MVISIKKLCLGICNCYLLGTGDRYVLVDAGTSKKQNKFAHCLQTWDIHADQIKLIVITHVHYDHVGSLAAIKEMVSAPVACHRSEQGLLSRGSIVIPPGATRSGRLISMAAKKFRFCSLKFTPVEPDIIIDKALDLSEFGLPGHIRHTPGHTIGSISVMLATGDVFIGDLAFSCLPFGFGSVFPPFAEDFQRVLQSWKRLVLEGANMLYPGHGLPFHVSRLKREMDRRIRYFKEEDPID